VQCRADEKDIVLSHKKRKMFYYTTTVKKILTRKNINRHCLLFFVFTLAVSARSTAQNIVPKEFSSGPENAKTDSSKIFILQQIADYYFALKNETAGDSIINIQMMPSYESGSRNLICRTLFGNAGFISAGASSGSAKMRNSKTQEYIQRALDYAKTNALKEYEAIAWARQAEQYLSEGKKNEALQTAQFGFATAMNTDNDSVKVLCRLTVGNVYLQKGDILMAIKSFTYALDIADNSINIYL
jgi:tetratricopeptide (TPR) repeat protein